MDRKESRLVIDGNAFYELDLECIRCKENNTQALEADPYNPESEDSKISYLHSVMQDF